MTGASSGIGAKLAVALVRAGLIVVGLARRADRVQELAASLKNEKGKLYAVRCDVAKEEDILSAFQWVEKEFGGVDILVNNAGVLYNEPIIEGKTEHFRQIMNVNVIAMAICTREAVQSMKKRNAPGHIINVNSYVGHYAENVKCPTSMYVASKYAVTGLTHSVRHELTAAKLNIKITSISPGAVETDMISQVLPKEHFDQFSMLKDADVADAVMYALSTPPSVQIYELIITPLNTASEMNKTDLIEALGKSSGTQISY